MARKQRQAVAEQQNPETPTGTTEPQSLIVTLYPVGPLVPDHARHGHSFTVQYRRIKQRQVDPAEFDLPADQRTVIAEEAQVRALNAGADIVIQVEEGEPFPTMDESLLFRGGYYLLTPWDGTTFDDRLTRDDKELVVSRDLAQWQCPDGSIPVGYVRGARFVVDRSAMWDFLKSHGVRDKHIGHTTWPEIMGLLRTPQKAEAGQAA